MRILLSAVFAIAFALELTLVLAAAPPAALATPAAHTKETAWLIDQTCGVLGDQSIYVSNTCINIEDRSTGIVTTARAPDWKVHTLDARSGAFAQSTLDSYRGYISDQEFVDTGTRWERLPLSSDAPTQVAGAQANTFKTPSSFTEKQLKDLDQESAAVSFVKSARYCVAANLPLPRQAVRIACRFYQLPEKSGFPLQFKYYNLANNMTTWLFTSKINSGAFNPPAPTATSGSLQKLADAKAVRETRRRSSEKLKEKKKRPLL